MSKNLIPYTKYSVQVLAENKIGISNESRSDDQSKSVITTEPARPNKNPNILEIIGKSPAEIFVRWEEIPSKFYNGPDFQYVLEYCHNLNEDALCEQLGCSR